MDGWAGVRPRVCVSIQPRREPQFFFFFLDVKRNHWTIYTSKNCLVSCMDGEWIVKGFRGRRELVREMKQSVHH